MKRTLLFCLLMLLALANINAQCNQALTENTHYVVTTEQITCNNANNGTLTAKIDTEDQNYNKYIYTLTDSSGTIISSTTETTATEHTFTDLTPGTYNAIVKAINQQPTPPDISSTPTSVIKFQELQLLGTCNSGSSLHWYSDPQLTQEITNLTVSPTENTTYYAVCVSDAGCESEASELLVTVDCPDITGNFTEDLGEVMNQISPNGDGKNDRWIIENIECYPDNKVEIRTRWGALVFKLDGYNNTTKVFDGKMLNGDSGAVDGTQVTTGTFSYIIFVDGQKPITGWLYITR